MNNQIVINGKTYNLAKLSLSKLEHLLQLALIEEANYQVICKNYPKDRMEKYGKPYAKRLADVSAQIKQYIELKKHEANN
jgi:hypothetical protein